MQAIAHRHEFTDATSCGWRDGLYAGHTGPKGKDFWLVCIDWAPEAEPLV